jgi:hypothetical protein
MAQLRLLYQSVEKIMPLELEQQKQQQQMGMQGSGWWYRLWNL